MQKQEENKNKKKKDERPKFQRLHSHTLREFRKEYQKVTEVYRQSTSINHKVLCFSSLMEWSVYLELVNEVDDLYQDYLTVMDGLYPYILGYGSGSPRKIMQNILLMDRIMGILRTNLAEKGFTEIEESTIELPESAYEERPPKDD